MPTAWYVGALDSRKMGSRICICETINDMQLPIYRTSKYKL